MPAPGGAPPPADAAFFFSGGAAEGVGAWPRASGPLTFVADHLSGEAAALALGAGTFLDTAPAPQGGGARRAADALAPHFASLAAARRVASGELAAALPMGGGNASLSAWVSCDAAAGDASAFEWGAPAAGARLALVVGAAAPAAGAWEPDTPLPVCDSTWHHVALVAAGGSQTAYVDGVALAPAVANELFIPATATSVRVGWNGTRAAFFGNVTDLRVFARALGAAEALSLASPPLLDLPPLALAPAPAAGATSYAWTCAAGAYGPPATLLERASAPPRAWLRRNDAALRCAPCPAGAWCAGGAPEPVLCSAGYASAAIGATSIDTCAACGANFYGNATGLSACIPCGAGAYSLQGPVTACSRVDALNASAALSLVSDTLDALLLGSNSSAAAGNATAAFESLALVGALSSLLANSSAAEAANNSTALRGALVDYVADSVASIANASTTEASAEASAQVTALLDGGTSNETTAKLIELAADVSVPLGDSAAVALTETLASLTAVPAQLSLSASLSSLESILKISELMLPVGVSSGAVDAIGGDAAAAAPLAAAFPPAAATAMLSVVLNVLVALPEVSAGAAPSSAEALEGASSQRLRESVSAAMSGIAASSLRATSGGGVISVSSGGASAFDSSASFCGAGLSMTAARIDALAMGATSVALVQPLAPCDDSSAAAQPQGALAAPAALLPPEFLAAATTGGASRGAAAIDVLVIQTTLSTSPLGARFDAAASVGLVTLAPPALSRVLTVSLQTRAGAPLAVVNASAAPANITIPYTSTTIAAGAAPAAVAAAYAGARFGVTFRCPASGTPTGAGVTALSAALFAGGPAARPSLFVVRAGADSSTVAVPCPAPVGIVNVSCASSSATGAAAPPVSFTCPAVTFAPLCSYFDTARGLWSSAGCVAAASTSASVTCACAHLTDFAARAAAFSAQQTNVAAALSSGTAFSPAGSQRVAVLLGALFAVFAALLYIATSLDARGAPLFAHALAADAEVRALAELEKSYGDGGFLLDRLAPLRGNFFGSKVAALDAGPTLVVSASSGGPVASSAPSTSSSTGSRHRPLTDAARVASARVESTFSDSLHLSLHALSPRALPAGADAEAGVQLPVAVPAAVELPTAPFARAWAQGHLLAASAALRIAYQHPFVSIFTAFNAVQSRASRLITFALLLAASLFVVSFLYSWSRPSGGAEESLTSAPAIAIADAIGAAFISAAVLLPLRRAIKLVAARVGVVEFKWRYPRIAAEVHRRRATEAQLRGLSLDALEAKVAALERRVLTSASADGEHEGAAATVPPGAAASSGLEPPRRRACTSAALFGGAFILFSLSQGVLETLGALVLDFLGIPSHFAESSDGEGDVDVTNLFGDGSKKRGH